MNFYIYPIIVSVKIHNTIYIKPYMAASLLSLRSMNIMYIKYYIKTSVYIYNTFYTYPIIVFVKIHNTIYINLLWMPTSLSPKSGLSHAPMLVQNIGYRTHQCRHTLP